MLTLNILAINGGAMNPVLVDDGKELLLIDCGVRGSLEPIQEASAKAGIDLGRLSRIIITHHDHDHTGALNDLVKAYPGAKVMASVIEKEYIEGAKKSIRLSQAEAQLENAPENTRGPLLDRIAMLKAAEPGKIDITVSDGDFFDWCGGVKIVATPGHMPGHVAVYLEAFKAIVTGDSLTRSNGALSTANPGFTLDMAEAKRSAEKLLVLEPERIICYHGGEVEGDVRGSLKAIIENWPEV